MSTGKEVDREKIEMEWKARGFSCDLWVDPPGQVWEDYVHSTDELLMLMEGKLELECRGKAFRRPIGEKALSQAKPTPTSRTSAGPPARGSYGIKPGDNASTIWR